VSWWHLWSYLEMKWSSVELFVRWNDMKQVISVRSCSEIYRKQITHHEICLTLRGMGNCSLPMWSHLVYVECHSCFHKDLSSCSPEQIVVYSYVRRVDNIERMRFIMWRKHREIERKYGFHPLPAIVEGDERFESSHY
jgi:hypothetical protein